MNTLEFISKLITSLAWPITVVILAHMLKTPLLQLIPLIRKLKYKELELEFSEALKKIGNSDDDLLKVQDQSMQDATIQKFLNIIYISPKAGVIEAWGDLEKSIIDCAIRHNYSSSNKKYAGIGLVIDYLMNDNHITKAQYNMIMQLKELRNMAVHNQDDFEISEQDAKNYVGKAMLLIMNISKQ